MHTEFGWGNLRRKRPFGRPWCVWEVNTIMILQEVECGGMDWSDQAQDRVRWRSLVNKAINHYIFSEV